jgi:hypothetical protein
MSTHRYHRALWTLGLLAGLLGSCAPAAGPAPEAEAIEIVSAVATPTPRVPAVEPTPPAVATSRGDGLVASNPAEVKLASGRPALIEFFRFT